MKGFPWMVGEGGEGGCRWQHLLAQLQSAYLLKGLHLQVL